jgi:MFS family permease
VSDRGDPPGRTDTASDPAFDSAAVAPDAGPDTAALNAAIPDVPAADDGLGARPGRAPLGPNFRRLFGATAAANLGDGLMAIALVWFASALTRDPLLIALIGVSSRIPWLLFSLPAGVITDRFDRRRLVGLMDLARCAVMVAFVGLIAALGRDVPSPEALDAGAPAPEHAGVLVAGLCVLSLLIGTAEVVRDNSAQTLLPEVVGKDNLPRANSRLWGVEVTMNQFVGPPLAGVLLAVAVIVPFGANALLLLVSGLLVLSLRGGFAPAGEARTTGRIAWRREIGEGITWLWRRPVLRSLALALSVMNMASSVGAVVFVLYAQEILGLFDGWAFGVLLAGAAAGAVLGSLVGERFAERLGDARALIAAVLAMGLAYVVVAFTDSPVLVWIVQFVSGVAVVLWNVISVSLRQRIIPDHLLGRVNSVYRFFGWGTISIGTLLGGVVVAVLEGWVGREWGLRSAFLVAAAGYLVMVVFVARNVTTARIEEAKEAAGD